MQRRKSQAEINTLKVINPSQDNHIVVRELVTIRCPGCGRMTKAYSYDGIIKGRCFVSNKDVLVKI